MGSSTSSNGNRAGTKTPSEGAHCLGMASTKAPSTGKVTSGADKLATHLSSKS